MREILFRGKRIDNGEWVYGYYFIEERDIEDGIIWRDIPQIQQRYGDHFQYFDVDLATVGQYTGLHDKNGKRIFEGDILQVYNYKCVVKFGMHEACNGWYAETDDGVICELNDSFKIAEIISTIHDKEVPT